EESFALLEAQFRIRVGIQEDVTVIERGDELDVAREQHPVAEDVARHIAYAGHGEIGGLCVDAHLAEVAFDRFPRAARLESYRVVIVAGGAARREGVVQPEVIFPADRIGVIGEGGRTLVGGDDQVRIVLIVAPYHRRRRYPALYEVVRQIQQSAQIVLITFHAFFQVRLAVGGRRGALGD